MHTTHTRTAHTHPCPVRHSADMASHVVTPVIVLPGSGCTPTRECNFYAWFGDAIEKTGRYRAVMKNMPGGGPSFHAAHEGGAHATAPPCRIPTLT